MWFCSEACGYSVGSFLCLQSVVRMCLRCRFMTYIRFHRGQSCQQQQHCLSALVLDLCTLSVHCPKSVFVPNVSIFLQWFLISFVKLLNVVIMLCYCTGAICGCSMQLWGTELTDNRQTANVCYADWCKYVHRIYPVFTNMIAVFTLTWS